MNPLPDHLLNLGFELRRRSYSFTTITPESHRRVLERRGYHPSDPLRSIFGWNKPFLREELDASLLNLLEAADCLEQCTENPGLWKSRVRFSTMPLHSDRTAVFMHSSYPTQSEDSVFFGPDTYRYVQFVESRLKLEIPARFFARAIDLGAGSGAGGLVLQSHCEEMTLSDVNELALRYSQINESLNPSLKNDAYPAKINRVKSDLFKNISGDFDLIMANPPFIQDEAKRAYRDGGERWGAELSIASSMRRSKGCAPPGC